MFKCGNLQLKIAVIHPTMPQMRLQFHINVFAADLNSSLYGEAREIKEIHLKVPLSMGDGETCEKKLGIVKCFTCLL